MRTLDWSTLLDEVRNGISLAETAFAKRLTRSFLMLELVWPTDDEDEWRWRVAMSAVERRTRAPFTFTFTLTLARLGTSGTASAAAAANRGPEGSETTPPPALPPLPPTLEAARYCRLRRGTEIEAELEVAEDAEATGSGAIPNEPGQSDARTASPAREKH